MEVCLHLLLIMLSQSVPTLERFPDGMLVHTQILLSCTVLLLCAILAGQHHLERYKEQHEQAQQQSRSARRSSRTRRISNAVVLGEALLFSALSATIGARHVALFDLLLMSGTVTSPMFGSSFSHEVATLTCRSPHSSQKRDMILLIRPRHSFLF